MMTEITKHSTVKIIVDGKEKHVPAGISVATAVLGHNHSPENKNQAFYYNSMNAEPRAPHCLMGVCFECMLEIDGKENIQSCLVQVKENMIINRQKKVAPFTVEADQNEGF